MAEKVQYGICNVYLFARTEGTGGAISYASPIHAEGAVSLSLDPQSEENVFYADNTRYYISNSSQGYEGELELAFLQDDVKLAFMGYVEASNNNIVETNAQGAPFGMVFQFETDDKARRVVLYNCKMGKPSEEHETTEDSTEPATVTVPFSCNGEAVTIDSVNRMIYKAEIHNSDANYSTAFTALALPTFGS